MGHELLYCARCGNRISGEDFGLSRAFRLGARAVCAGCIRKELALAGEYPQIAMRPRKRLRARIGLRPGVERSRYRG